MTETLAYYNENDPYAAAWLRNLIALGHVALGDVDERSIADVRPSDLAGYTQCHFFAGIGGWSLALRLAGWPDDRPVWTGSCPCQPFSIAGARLGTADPRHLWPTWLPLIQECRPPVIFGEQVDSALAWFDQVANDLEGEEYAVAAAIIPACTVAAPHMRDRLWFLADAGGTRPPLGEANAGGMGGARPRQEGLHAPSNDAATWRPWVVEPAMGCVAHGVPGRVGRLRALGNAIVVAAVFIRAAV